MSDSPVGIPNSPCILWTKYINPYGYGMLRRNYRTWLAHRWAWTEAHGPIPDGMVVRHLCNVRACVRVDHLALGTHVENYADMVAAGRAGWQRGRDE